MRLFFASLLNPQNSNQSKSFPESLHLETKWLNAWQQSWKAGEQPVTTEDTQLKYARDQRQSKTTSGSRLGQPEGARDKLMLVDVYKALIVPPELVEEEEDSQIATKSGSVVLWF